MVGKVGGLGDLKSRVKEAIQSWTDEIIDFTKALVAIKTENPPGVLYRVCADMIAHKLQDIGLDCEMIEVPAQSDSGSSGRGRIGFGDSRLDRPGRSGAEGPGKLGRSTAEGPRHSVSTHEKSSGSGTEAPGDSTSTHGASVSSGAEDTTRYCLLGHHGCGAKTLYFHGHYDVVPASNDAQFNPSVRDGALFGRGSSDMKGGLAAMIYAARALKECEVPLDGRICLTIVPDEETGGALGSRYLADTGILGKGGVGMLTAEPTSGAVWNSSRGALSLRVIVKGKPAHVGLHYKGVNAFEQMLAVAKALLELKSEVELRKTSSRISPDEARRSVLLIGGQCEGGANFNAVPERCSFTVDRRINPEENLAEERERLLALFRRLRDTGIAIDVEVLQEGESSSTPEDGPLAVALSKSAKEVCGRSPAFEMCPGLLETRFYTDLGLPALAYGPGLLSVSHGPGEFVKIKDICDCAAVYALTAARVLQL